MLFKPIESNSGSFSPFVQFVWADLKTAIVLGCGLKQPHRDRLEEVILVQSQTAVFHLCYNLTQLQGVAYSTKKVKHCSHSQVHSGMRMSQINSC